MIDTEWLENLVSDIIEQNCLECEEFRKPTATSCCWCPSVFDIVDNELYIVDDCTEEMENLVAATWEILRKKVLETGE